MNIVVYLGSNYPSSSIYKDEVIKLGKYIGNNNHTLVYGGSNSGLMGELASSVVNSNGKVIGVQTKKFDSLGYSFNRLNELIITEDMTLRKLKMIELGDIFIAFPGGSGTLEEISEVISKSSLKELNNKVIIYNINHYYDDLVNFFNKMIKENFSNKDKLSNLYFINNLEELDKIIKI